MRFSWKYCLSLQSLIYLRYTYFGNLQNKIPNIKIFTIFHLCSSLFIKLPLIKPFAAMPT